MADVDPAWVKKAAEAIWMRSGENRNAESWEFEAEIALEAVLTDVTRAAAVDLRPDESVYRIGETVYAGTACVGCGTSYWACTDAVLRERTPFGPDPSPGCCDECRDESGHRVRALNQIAGLVATVAAQARAKAGEDVLRRIQWLSMAADTNDALSAFTQIANEVRRLTGADLTRSDEHLG